VSLAVCLRLDSARGLTPATGFIPAYAARFPSGTLKWTAAVPQGFVMTSQGSAHGRFTRAIQRRNLFQVELAMRELGTLSLLDALAYLELLHAASSPKLERAAIRWHGRLETEAQKLTLAESQLALAAVASLHCR
jgi:hypothetical protein